MVLRLCVSFYFFVAYAMPVASCECKLAGDFAASAKQANLVVHIRFMPVPFKKNRYGRPGGMTAEIIQVFQGRENRKSITIWGSTGKDCRPLVSQFKTTRSYKIALTFARDDGFEKSSDYTTSVCGVHWQEL